MLSAWHGAEDAFDKAIAEDPGFALAHAQRELWEDTLIVAYLRAGHGDRAARRISARLDRRPSARDEAWSRQAPRN
jgi:GAF domain-containing protein